MPQFLISKNNIIEENLINLTDKQDIIHITKVLRKKIGDNIDFAGMDGMLYRTQIIEFDKEYLTAKILSKKENIHRLKSNITLFQAILKSNAQDITIQKATELGTFEICPIITQFCVINLKNDKEKTQKIVKWQKIALESCKQCERAIPPVIERILPLKDALKLDYDIKIACIERKVKQSLKEILRDIRANQKIAIFIGPEGGWADFELELFNKHNVQKVSLGNMILRAETASISAISGVVYELE